MPREKKQKAECRMASGTMDLEMHREKTDNPAEITRKKRPACSEVEKAGVPIDRVSGYREVEKLR